MYFKWVGLQSQVVISWSSWPPFKCKEPLFCSLIEALRTPTHFLYPEPVMRTVTTRLSADLLGKKNAQKDFAGHGSSSCHIITVLWLISHHSIWTVMSLFTTRGGEREQESVCVGGWSALYTVHILPSKSWPVFSSRADMPGPPRVHTRARALPHLASAISESSADSRQDFWDQASTYLSCCDLLTTSTM